MRRHRVLFILDLNLLIKCLININHVLLLNDDQNQKMLKIIVTFWFNSFGKEWSRQELMVLDHELSHQQCAKLSCMILAGCIPLFIINYAPSNWTPEPKHVKFISTKYTVQSGSNGQRLPKSFRIYPGHDLSHQIRPISLFTFISHTLKSRLRRKVISNKINGVD